MDARKRILRRLAVGVVCCLGLSVATLGVSAQGPAAPAAQAQVSEDPIHPQEALRQLGIVGYADTWSAEPGEDVDFMVSTESPQYRATMVRVIHGDPNPQGPGVKEEVIDTDVNQEYPGQFQTLPLGSYVTVPGDQALGLQGSFTITAWIAPTTIPGSDLNPLALRRTPVHTPRPQGIVTKWSDDRDRGYGLFIDEDGSLALRLGSPLGRSDTIRTGVALRPWQPALPGASHNTNPPNVYRPQMTPSRWYFVAASYDAASGKVMLYQLPQSDVPDPTEKVLEATTDVRRLARIRQPLLMAAHWTDKNEVGGFYNGKIDSPRIFDRALSGEEIESIRAGEPGPTDAIAAWDFSQEMSSDRVVDVGPRQLHGQAVNLPVRAVTGHNWTADVMDFKDAPEEYGAMHFHEDDLADAAWDTSFTFRVPDDLPSGVYAAKLETGEHEYYVPFVVRPPKGSATAEAAFLVPTFTYQAYAETGAGAFSPGGLSQYATHSDGSGVFYSTHLRPWTNMRPKHTESPTGIGMPWGFEADTHLVDWLDAKGFDVDFITDHDLHEEGVDLLRPYNAVLTGSHPEYDSEQMLNGIEAYLEGGGRLLYLGGNGFYWITPMAESGLYTELRRHDGTEAWQAAPGEYYHSTTGEYGGLWVFRGRPPQQLVGVGFTAQGFGHVSGAAGYSRPYERMPDAADPRARFVFEGIDPGELIGDEPSLQWEGGAAGEELDRFDYALGSPADTLVLATASGFGDEYLFVVEEVNGSDLWQGGSVNPLVKADMTLLFYPNNGAVFSASSISWSGSLYYNNYDNDVSRITENVLRALASDDPLPTTSG